SGPGARTPRRFGDHGLAWGGGKEMGDNASGWETVARFPDVAAMVTRTPGKTRRVCRAASGSNGFNDAEERQQRPRLQSPRYLPRRDRGRLVVQTTIVIFPFDLFGSPGAAAGATLLADELREIVADNKRERVPTRADAYTGHVRFRELYFERLDDYP